MEENKDFIICVNLLGKEIDELSYEKKGENLNICLKPKYGEFSPADVSFETPADAENHQGFLKLFGRIMARLQKISSRNVWWSFVPEEDFAKTGTTPRDIGAALVKIKNAFEMPTLAVFWAETKSPTIIKGSIISENGEMLQSLARKIAGEIRENRLSFNLGQKKPEEAIKEFFKLI